MKICGKCDKEKELKEFNKNNQNKKTGLSAYCKECQRKNNKKHYKNNKEKYIENSIKNKIWYYNLKIGLKCNRCGFDNPVALDFHHKEPLKKEFEINYNSLLGKNKEQIKMELNKCEILCSNCHRIEHATRFNKHLINI